MLPDARKTAKDNDDKAKAMKMKAALSNLKSVSDALNTGLDIEQLRVCIRLCELGVNPEVLATMIKQLRAVAPKVNENQEMDISPTNRNV